MADRETQRMIQEQRELNRISAEQLRILKDQNEALEQQVKNSEERAELEEKILKHTSKGEAVSKALAKFDRSDLKSLSKRTKLTQNITDAQAEAAVLRRKADKLNRSGLKTHKDIAKTLVAQAETIEESVLQAGKLKREFNNFDKATKGFERISGLVNEIPVLRKAFSGFADMSKKAGEAYIETGSRSKAAMAGIKSGMKGGLQALLAGLIGGIVKGLGGIDAASVSLQRNLNLSKKDAQAFGQQLTKVAEKATVNLEELKQAAEGFSMAMGSGAPASAETAEQLFTLSTRLGVGAEQAGNLYRFSTLTGESFKSTTDQIVGQVKALNFANKSSIKYSDILKDVGTASEATLFTTQKFPGGIAKAAFEARKFGLSLGQLEKTSSSLLSFQSSIESELEAELLTGRKLNLEEARKAALMGDQAKLASEVAKNIGTSAEFADMNVIQQESLAKAFGMSRDELAKTLMQQDALNKLQKENPGLDLVGKGIDEQIANATKFFQQQEGLTFDEAKLKALEKLGREEMAAQLKAETAQKSFQNSLEGVGNMLGKLVSSLTGTDNPLEKLSSAIQNMNNLLSDFITRAQSVGFTRALFGGGREATLANDVKRATNSGDITKEQAEEIKALADEASTYAVQAAAAKTMGFSSALGGGSYLTGLYYDMLAGKRAKEGDAALTRAKKENVEIPVNDFQIKTHPKDTLVMAGGTRFGEETNTLLKELITAVKSGGHVYIDGRKVGETLALNYTAIG